jgi:ketosteroid isomerase-like protein
VVEIDAFRDWLERYFQAWVSNDAADVAALFTEDAVYRFDALQEPRRGGATIVKSWTEGRPQEDVDYAYEPLAVSGDVGIAHWKVRSRLPDKGTRFEIDGILVISFAADGRCREHREWYSHRELP